MVKCGNKKVFKPLDNNGGMWYNISVPREERRKERWYVL